MTTVGLDESVIWPARMTKPAPATGQRALVPGYEVESLKTRSAYAIATNPMTPKASPHHVGTLRTATEASSPPNANSHARVGRLKNAQLLP